jgi:acyl-CoA synthetase (AMP-forming)/AMP-acid ligase II
VTTTLALGLESAGGSPFEDLRTWGQRPAVNTGSVSLSYADLADRVDAQRELFGPARRLVLLTGDNDLDALVAYLAALAAGQAVIMVPGDHPQHLASLVDRYDPDVVCSAAAGWRPDWRREDSAHELHPGLALLLSTSGSTGSPKLVRLSSANLRANAASIASYLDITERDRAITSLPLHYCYGLSVVNSHLMTGAGLVLTNASVVDPGFWHLAADCGATSFAGVPYTFELLDQTEFSELDLPDLRYVTQAGGRMSPERVLRYSELGQRRGWDFYVMYGQTEATARMAYLPPELATAHPTAIGVPVPGGSLRIDPAAECPEPGAGELVYSGPNVMMGYANAPSDLRLGSSLGELRTGDLARQTSDGVFEIIGRKSRFAKVFGSRIDLDDLERHLSDTGVNARCVSAADSIWVFVERRRHSEAARQRVAGFCGLPLHSVQGAHVEAMPTTPSGKPDYGALERHADLIVASTASRRPQPRHTVTAAELRDLYAHLLGRPDATVESTFVSLGGDSLSYVELSVRLGDALGHLPRDWHTQPVMQLAGAAPTIERAPSASPAPRRRLRSRAATIETSVLVRALAIVLIVANHSNVVAWYGGAHVLLGVAGYNFARFQLTASQRLDRVRQTLSSVLRIAVPSIAWIGSVAIFTGTYDAKTAVFLNGLLGSDNWTVQWQFWFLEALVWMLLALVALLAIPRIDQLERRAPFGFALAIVAAALVVRYASVGVEAGPTERYMPSIVAWCFALGWAAARATTAPQRLLVTVIMVAATVGFFDDLRREATIIVCLAALLWLPSVRAPRLATTVLGVLASSSLYVYLTHWQVYPHLEVDHPLLAVLASFAVGIVYWRAVGAIHARVRPLAFRRLGPEARPGRAARQWAGAWPSLAGPRKRSASRGLSRG